MPRYSKLFFLHQRLQHMTWRHKWQLDRLFENQGGVVCNYSTYLITMNCVCTHQGDEVLKDTSFSSTFKCFSLVPLTVCVCVCVCYIHVHICVLCSCACVCDIFMCTCVWEGSTSLVGTCEGWRLMSCFLSHFSPIFLRQGCSLSLESVIPHRLIGQRASTIHLPEVCLSLPPSAVV